MKTTKILPVLVWLCSPALTAQVTLTAAIHLPQPGDVEHFRVADTTGIYPGPGGAAQNWNFSGISVYPGTEMRQYIAPSASLNPQAFQSAAYGIVINGNTQSTSFMDYSGNVLSWAGDGYGTNGVLQLTDPQALLFFPAQYIDSLTDTYSWLSTPNPCSNIVHGSTHIKADGYGVLQLPYGSFNTVRVCVVDSFMYHDTCSSPVPHTNYTYTWYAAAYKFPLLSYAVTYESQTRTPGLFYIAAGDFSGLAAETAEENRFLLYPNPAAHSCSIRYRLQEAAEVQVRILDLAGRLVYTEAVQQQAGGEHTANLAVADLQPGVYFVQLRCGSESSTRKLIIR